MLSHDSSGFVAAFRRNSSSSINAAPSSTKFGFRLAPFAWVPFWWVIEREGLLLVSVDSDMWQVYSLPVAASTMSIEPRELMTAS